jgi:hypothetical protein
MGLTIPHHKKSILLRKIMKRKPRHSLIDSIKMDLVEVGWGVEDWMGVAQDTYRGRALAKAVMNLQVP